MSLQSQLLLRMWKTADLAMATGHTWLCHFGSMTGGSACPAQQCTSRGAPWANVYTARDMTDTNTGLSHQCSRRERNRCYTPKDTVRADTCNHPKGLQEPRMKETRGGQTDSWKIPLCEVQRQAR